MNRACIRLRALLLATIPASILSAAPAGAQESEPLALAQASYFFVGGRIDTAAEGSPMLGHMYVESMIPRAGASPIRS
jgi:hypothetical protein